ncbi:uncharacterized protein CLUP02_12539 [Colletotrichum lupini]|uniref:Uncharacterized protein n=1 Tax=Colletotrichum lupini TaxID=145971 RepID=A0A9Q8WLD0_9PEZI|nr:uncharacterized protein CLUP02_12539 [Colletotrichum lupini]UQC87037.1 hypothetical protein CLUP02_12539 [Colletotrichum lupini]
MDGLNARFDILIQVGPVQSHRLNLRARQVTQDDSQNMPLPTYSHAAVQTEEAYLRTSSEQLVFEHPTPVASMHLFFPSSHRIARHQKKAAS